MEESWNLKKWPNVMEFCDSVMEFCPQFVLNLYVFGQRQDIKQRSRKSAFSDVFCETSQIQNQGERWSWIFF